MCKDKRLFISIERKKSKMKFLLLNRTPHLRFLIVMLGLVLMSARPAQSLDSMIAFASNRDGKLDIFIMKANGSQQRNLTKSPILVDNSPFWSPDGRKIVFERHGKIYVINKLPDGENLINLTPNQPLNPGSSDPAWSSDGRKIAFERDSDIYVMNANGENPVNLTRDLASNDKDPAWSPDGRKIAFERNWDIYVMNANGTKPVRLTFIVSFHREPAWSPDGRKIAFRSNRDGNWEIYVMNADGTNQTQLTHTASLPNDHPIYNRNPFWSPDGRKIGFDSNRDGNWEIYVMSADGDNPTNLTRHPADDVKGSWVLGELAVSPKARLLTLWGKIKTTQGDGQ